MNPDTDPNIPEIPGAIQSEVTEFHQKTLPTDKLCNECMELNLLQAGVTDTFRVCPTCGELFCLHAASHLDPQYCIFCCNDFQFNSTDEIVTREVRDESGNLTSKKSFRIRHMTLGGDHYLFHNRAIKGMSDTELDCGIEYHRGLCNGMIREREDRRIAHAHRYKGQTAGNEFTSLLGANADGVPQFTLSPLPAKRTRTVKTRAVSQSTADAKRVAAENLIDKLLKQGMTPERFAKLVGKMG